MGCRHSDRIRLKLFDGKDYPSTIGTRQPWRRRFTIPETNRAIVRGSFRQVLDKRFMVDGKVSCGKPLIGKKPLCFAVNKTARRKH